MYSLIHRMRVSQLKPQFLGAQHKPGFLRSERIEGAIWLSRALYEQSLHREMLGNHFGEQRRRASGNNPDNPSSFVRYHHRLSIRPAKIPDQGLSLRLRHVWKSWGAGPGNEVAVPSRKEDNRVAFLARSFFFAATLPLAWPLCTCFVFGCCSCSNMTGKMSRIIVIFDIFWTICSLFLRSTRVKFNWLLSRQHVHLKKKGF